MKFGYTILYVNDVEETIAFYEKAFGLVRSFVHESGYGELDTGGTKLAFARFELASSHGFAYQKSDPKSVPLGFEIALVTEDVDAAFGKAVSAGALSIQKPGKKPWGQRVGYVRDLNGFVVEICSPVG
ncbi:MAG TPA: VOC family protein [Fibrobacteria bacterium]|nr:VOC family protein [Fibrobacteria bacterium]